MNVSLLKTLSLKPLITAIAISSALALSACGGGSDSSGSSSNGGGTKSKIDTLHGSWKSECMNYTEDNRSAIVYVKTNKLNNTSMSTEAKFSWFKGVNCNSSNLVATRRQPAKSLKGEELEESLEDTTIINNNKISVRDINEDTNKVESMTFTRISNSKYDAIPSEDVPEDDHDDK